MKNEHSQIQNKQSVYGQFKLAAIETVKKNGLYCVAAAFWLSGIAVLTFNNQFNVTGGNLFDNVSGWIDLAAIALTPIGNPVYSLTALMAVTAAGLQQFPYIAKGDMGIMANYFVYTLGTIPAIAEKWLEPRAKSYLAKRKPFGIKSVGSHICANGRITASVVQSLCHLPTICAAYASHDHALMTALGLFIAGNAADGCTKIFQYRRRMKDLSL